MPNNYSLNAAGLTYSGSLVADVPPVASSFIGPSSLDAVQRPLSGLGLALANVSQVINRLVVEQMLLRGSLEAFNASLLKQVDIRHKPVDKASTEPESTQMRRQAYETSTTRLSTAVDKAQAPVVDASLMILTEIVDGLTFLAEALPKTTAAISLAGAVLVPLISGVFGAVRNKVFDKAAGRVLGEGSAPTHHESSGASKDNPANPKRSSIKPSRSRLFSIVAKLGEGVQKAVLPLLLVGASVDIGRGVATGDMKAVGAGVASAGGAVAGGYAGSAAGSFVGGRIGGLAGAALGSIIPGAGTLLGGVLGSVIGSAVGKTVGGVIGNFAGSDIGGWLSEKVMGTPDRLRSPTDVSKDLSNAQSNNRQINFAPQITINAPEQASHQELATLVVQQIEAQFTPLSMGELYGARADAALNDGRV